MTAALTNCSRCNGTGKFGKALGFLHLPCGKCKGKGIIDWVKNITWKVEDDYPEAKPRRKTGGMGAS